MCHSLQSCGLLAGQEELDESTHNSDSDEYSDDDDPGYTRQDIRGQEAFISRELDLSDDEGSHRGPLSYPPPSPGLKPSHSSDKASSYMAEPPGTSVYDSEAASEQSHSKSHQPDGSSIHAAQQPFNLTLRPDPTILGTAKADTAADAVPDAPDVDADTAALQADASQNEPESSASSASFTNTDVSGRDVAGEATRSSSPSNSNTTSKPADEAVQKPSIVHQTSGIRYLLDNLTEKVTDAFTRHGPKSTPRPTNVSEDPDAEAEDEEAEQALSGLMTLRGGNMGSR